LLGRTFQAVPQFLKGHFLGIFFAPGEGRHDVIQPDTEIIGAEGDRPALLLLLVHHKDRSVQEADRDHSQVLPGINPSFPGHNRRRHRRIAPIHQEHIFHHSFFRDEVADIKGNPFKGLAKDPLFYPEIRPGMSNHEHEVFKRFPSPGPCRRAEKKGHEKSCQGNQDD